jgi:hypothetical protein
MRGRSNAQPPKAATTDTIGILDPLVRALHKSITECSRRPRLRSIRFGKDCI